MTRRRVAVITGTRAEYGLLRSVCAAIHAHPKLQLQVIATGMHLLPRFGRTIDEIRRDVWPTLVAARMQAGDDAALDQALGLSRGVAALAKHLDELRPEVVLVLGDRVEALAGALAAVTTDRVLGHIHGGDVAAGDFDDAFRHAITKLAHVHFAASRRAARRIARLGEEPHRIHLCGAPGLDDLATLSHTFDAPRGEHVLVIQHAYGRPADREARAASAVLKAVAATGRPHTVVYPNSDRGNAGVLRAIEAHAERVKHAKVVKSLPRPVFLEGLLTARLLVGNSSAGFIEAPFAGVPVVNVGERQRGREPGGHAIVHCDETRRGVTTAIERALRLRPRRGGANVYGDGRAGQQIADQLARIKIERLRKKLLAY